MPEAIASAKRRATSPLPARKVSLTKQTAARTKVKKKSSKPEICAPTKKLCLENRVGLFLYARPVVASRPRVTRWGTYYSATYKNYMALLDEAIPAHTAPFTGNVHVDVEFVCHRPKTTKRINPLGDIDNYCKAIFDAITKKGYWADDDLIVDLQASKRFVESGETPHTSIWIEPYELEAD
ncbi:RusA family crossover junction endodeoxyribonuclease [Microbulbifer sp. 2201CG32-9]|uniref:RusA family crossover junction endodeoxyribonuclease n=1 Tax=Microbulbifer sp. 2201CG32-9 TaxID=3232309 RepID=UPI00345BCB73